MSVMLSRDEVLERAAKDGFVDSEDWARVFDDVLKRLEHNVYQVFIIPASLPQPAPPAPIDQPSSPPKPKSPELPASESQADSTTQPTNKENEPPSSPPQPSPTSVPLNPPAETVSTSSTSILDDPTLPSSLQSIWAFVKQTLKARFAEQPPHTVQRLAELILRPRHQYRHLPAYLNALDRIVSVSSTSNFFPLPAVELPQPAGAGALVNGTSRSTSPSVLGSDDSLGGALLTPIPWLRRGSQSASSSPATSRARLNGVVNHDETPPASDSEDPSDIVMGGESQQRDTGAVTQGELLRQEQEASEPPAALASAGNREHTVAMHSADVEEEVMEEEASKELEELPHARGPDRIGLEDTGPQDHAGARVGSPVLDMAAAVGRSSSRRLSSGSDKRTEDDAEMETETEAPPAIAPADQPQDVKTDKDGDVEITDVDGLTEEEIDVKGAQHGDNTAPDSVDASAR